MKNQKKSSELSGKYIKKYNKFTLQTNCRICLTQSITTMKKLTDPLKGELMPKPLIYEALKLVMDENIYLDTKYPLNVCPMCLELLKIAYDLKIQYRESQKKLKKRLQEEGDPIDDLSSTKEKNTDKKVACKPEKNIAPVELVVGTQKFDIKDLFIVEEEQKSSCEFKGFLDNLGTAISASFVQGGTTKKNIETEPSLVIEKVILDSEVDTQATMGYENNDSETTFLDPIKVDLKSVISQFELKNEFDREALEAALSLEYKCPYCHRPLSSLKNVRIHILNCGENTKNVTCYVCNKKFTLRKHLLTHIKAAHLSELKKFNCRVAKHQCKLCKKSFFTNGSLTYHIQKHKGKQYTCEECGKLFYTKHQLITHKNTHNRDQTLVLCPICGKTFHYQSGLFYHMKLHTNERKYQCSYCPRSFYTRNSLKRHELTHTGARPYSCQHCEKKFRSLGEVRKHEYLHTGVRPYQCKYCSMGFTQTHNLKIHLMTHPGDYQCPKCPRSLVEKEVLRFHLQNKHGIKSQVDKITVDEEEADDDFEDENQPNAFQSLREEEEEEEENIDGGDVTIEYEGETGEDGGVGQDYFISEEYEGDEVGALVEEVIVKNYEIRDQVLVETIEFPQ